MTTCPHCQNELKISPIVVRNVETYGKSVLSSTECCGHGVYVGRSVQLSVSPYNGERTEDDWGDTLKHKAIE